MVNSSHKVVSGLLIKHKRFAGTVHSAGQMETVPNGTQRSKRHQLSPLMSPSISITSSVHVSYQRKISHLQIMTSQTTMRNTEGHILTRCPAINNRPAAPPSLSPAESGHLHFEVPARGSKRGRSVSCMKDRGHNNC